jgi:hypothetical protein
MPVQSVLSCKTFFQTSSLLRPLLQWEEFITASADCNGFNLMFTCFSGLRVQWRGGDGRPAECSVTHCAVTCGTGTHRHEAGEFCWSSECGVSRGHFGTSTFTAISTKWRASSMYQLYPQQWINMAEATVSAVWSAQNVCLALVKPVFWIFSIISVSENPVCGKCSQCKNLGDVQSPEQ